MTDWNQVSRADVLAAITEHDQLGSREFLSRYRFPRSRASTLWHRGQEYDPQAILGLASLRAGSGSGVADEETSIQVLSGMGFDVVVDEDALAAVKAKAATRRVASTRSSGTTTRTRTARSTTARSTTARSSTAAKAPASKPRRTTEPETKICPTCFMALPATGICDNCD